MRVPVPAVLALSLVTHSARGADKIAAAGGDIEITPILHSSVQVEHAGTVIQVDPWSLGDLSRAKPADLILVTDDQGHHLDPEAVRRLRKPAAPVVIPAIGKAKISDGLVLANGQSTSAAGIRVEAVAAYDLKPGEPWHPKGEANGYVVTLGGKRIYFSGVTECVPEIQALKDIDVAFMPMNLPLGRMTPAAVVECVKTFKPRVVYIYHFDQGYAARLANPNARAQDGAGTPASSDSIKVLAEALRGLPIEVRTGNWYPAR